VEFGHWIHVYFSIAAFHVHFFLSGLLDCLLCVEFTQARKVLPATVNWQTPEFGK
jgi:hypothetical protein